MRKLLNTLYVLSEEAYLTLDGENIVIKNGQTVMGRFPLHNLESIVCFSYQGASPALMGACAERNIGLTFFNPQGRYLANVNGKSFGNVLLRKEQYRISDSQERSCLYAVNMMTGKLYNSRWCLERTARDHAHRVNAEKLKQVSAELKEGIRKIRRIKDLDSLRGIEGEMATRYFSVFDEMIINQKESFQFRERSRRPPKDEINALLSFAYTLLAGDCANALESAGLDTYVGFMHRDRPGRKSLALDLMEELRAVMADRFVLTLVNMKVIRPEHFEIHQDEAVILTDEGRRQFLAAWQEKKREELTHPYLGEKVQWGLVPHIQAQLLARTIRGDLEQYPPFLWK